VSYGRHGDDIDRFAANRSGAPALFLQSCRSPLDLSRHSNRNPAMRLLDLIAQGQSACIHADDGRELPGAHRFRAQIKECPLRYVLSDELARCATQLAYAEGDRLSSCMDLIRVPARTLWVEWADGPRREALKAVPALEVQAGDAARRGGALVMASPDCRSGSIRTFWCAPDERAYLSPVVTTFDFDQMPEPSNCGDPMTWRGEAVLQMVGEPAIEELLEHLRFSFDDEWARYYHSRIHSAELRDKVLRTNIGCCAFDAPMLMAFFLLLGSRDLLPRQVVRHERLNRARFRAGKPALLEHVEVHAPLDQAPGGALTQSPASSRSSPRMHHVRGHIVRRGAAVFWRCPHLRGSARLGQVRSRTVVLTFGQSSAAAATYH
jgi:hypothetical protein